MDEHYVEAILAWKEAGPSPQADRWLAERGLRSTPMRAGLLVSGDRAAFEEAFGVALAQAEPPVILPVPAELADVVSSIAIPSPRRPGLAGRDGAEPHVLTNLAD